MTKKKEGAQKGGRPPGLRILPDDDLPTMLLKLTPHERKTVEVMIDPANTMLTVKSKIELIGCNTDTYYAIMNRPHMKEIVKKMVYEIIMHNATQMVNSAVKSAKKGSFPHFKTLMEMGQLHSDTKKVELEATVEHIVTFATDDDIDNATHASPATTYPTVIEAEWRDSDDEDA